MTLTPGELLQRCTALWWECGTQEAVAGRTYTVGEQAANEKDLARFVTDILAEARRPPRDAAERDALQTRLLAAGYRVVQSAFGFSSLQVEALRPREFNAVLSEFARQARRFDPALSESDIYQAGRNALTAHLLQLLLGRPLEFTPAIFAYSLLYPYTDNYLDDPGLSAGDKRAFAVRLQRRLSGETVAPAEPREQTMWQLVSMIERQFVRAAHPQVYDSLLAIHRAQSASVRLLQPGAGPYDLDVLGICLDKGGTSVLADAYLVAGTLTDAQAFFAFGLGAYLQLADDLEDVVRDTQAGLLTIFAQCAGSGRLDTLTRHTLRFGAQVMEGLDAFDTPGIESLKEALRAGMPILVMSYAAGAARLHTRQYLMELQTHMPFRFRFLEGQRKRVQREQVALQRLGQAHLWEAKPPQGTGPLPRSLRALVPAWLRR